MILNKLSGLKGYQEKGYICFTNIFELHDVVSLLNDLLGLEFKKADLVKGRVYQNYDQVAVDINNPQLKPLVARVETVLRSYSIMPEEKHFNSFLAHNYCYDKKVGISRHHDGKRFEGPIVVIILRRGGNFVVYENKDDKVGKVVTAIEGDCIVINNETEHMVLFEGHSKRVTLTLRYDSSPEKQM